MRTMTSRLIVENYKAYGASPVPTPWGEVYSGLQMGVLDGQVNCPFFIEEQHIDDVQNYLTFSYCNPFLMTLIVNPQFFDALPADIQKIVYETVEELLPFSFQWQIEFNEKRLKKMQERKSSLKVVYLNQEEVDVFKELAKPMREVYYEIARKRRKNISGDTGKRHRGCELRENKVNRSCLSGLRECRQPYSLNPKNERHLQEIKILSCENRCA